ncbi:hypothetical protein C8J57DRAFT_1721468 [Mycena rebaudengoi]|nr:hypothetical protein C8J57DRAFT_1721468 [Mycena rebaudengoi]
MSPGLNGNLGPTEIGSVVGAFLFGAMTLQTYHYYRGFQNDSVLLRSTVAVVWLLELAHTVCAWHALYSQTVTFYGQPEYISSPPYSEEMTILFAAILYLIVQTFFANRARVLSKNWYIMAVASALNVLRFIATMGSLALLLHYRRVSILLEWRWLVSTALALGLSVDILITLSMCYLLQKLRSSESERTRNIVETLILWSIESTILTSGTSIMQIILFLTRTDLVWTFFFIIQTKLFSNSMLASLNGRQRFRDSDKDSFEVIHFVSAGESKGEMITISLSLDPEHRPNTPPARLAICSQCRARPVSGSCSTQDARNPV